MDQKTDIDRLKLRVFHLEDSNQDLRNSLDNIRTQLDVVLSVLNVANPEFRNLVINNMAL